MEGYAWTLKVCQACNGTGTVTDDPPSEASRILEECKLGLEELGLGRRLAGCSLTTDHDAPHGLFIFAPILMILMLAYLILRRPAAKWNSASFSHRDLPASTERSAAKYH